MLQRQSIEGLDPFYGYFRHQLRMCLAGSNGAWGVLIVNCYVSRPSNTPYGSRIHGKHIQPTPGNLSTGDMQTFQCEKSTKYLVSDDDADKVSPLVQRYASPHYGRCKSISPGPTTQHNPSCTCLPPPKPMQGSIRKAHSSWAYIIHSVSSSSTSQDTTFHDVFFCSLPVTHLEPSATSTSTTSRATTSSSTLERQACLASASTRVLAFWSWGVVHEKGVEWEGIWRGAGSVRIHDHVA